MPRDEEPDLLGAQLAAVALARGSAPADEHQAPSRSTKRVISGARSLGRARGVAQRLLVAERLVPHALGEVGDRRDRGHAQPAVAGDDRLVHGRHADRVGAERAEGADLGGRLEARAARRAR